MKRLLASSLALALMSGAVLAQAAAPPPPPPPAGMKAPPPGGPATMDDAGPEGPRGPGPEGPRGHRPPPPPPSRAAHFRLEHGDTALDVKCADDEPMKVCADLTLQLLDKLQGLPKP